MKNDDRIRSKIIQATVHEIKNKGYEKISLRNLVRKVNLTTGAFYKRFPNKKSLFLRVTKIISLKIYHQILPKVGNYKSHPRQSLVQLGISVIKLFNTERNVMNFLFFNPELSEVYQNNQIGMKFSFLKLSKQIVSSNVSNEDEVDKEFIKLWSFAMGYCNLISNHICKFNLELLKETLNQLLGDSTNE